MSPTGGTYPANNGSSAEPWSFEYLNVALASGTSVIPDGSTIYFERGEVYHGQLVLIGKNSLTFDAFGVGFDPVISGADKVSELSNNGWEYHAPVGSAHIWSALLNGVSYDDLKGTSTRERLYLYRPSTVSGSGSTLLPLARTPNDAGDIEASWFRMDEWTISSIIDDAVTTLTLPTNSTQAVVRTTNWSYDVVNLVSKSGNTMVFEDAPFQYIDEFGENLEPGWGFFLRNYQGALDQADEWFAEQDGANTRLYLVTSTNQAPVDIEVGMRESCVTLFDCSDITFRNITFEKAYYGVSAYANDGNSSVNVKVESCTFQHLFNGMESTKGIGATNSGHQAEDCIFRECYNNAIFMASTSGVIRNNTITEIGEIPGRGATAWGYMGIRTQGIGTLIEGNQLSEIGFAGLMVEGDQATVQRNSITNALTTLNDGGGIFFEDGNGMLIEENIILDSFGTLNSVSPQANSYQLMACGIYFGQATTTNATVRKNIVANCEVGMIVDHNLINAHTSGTSPIHFIEDNTLFNNRSTQLFITDQSNRFTPGTDLIDQPLGQGGEAWAPAYNDTYRNNILYSLSARQRTMVQVHNWSSSYTDLVDYGNFEGGYYFNPFNELSNEVVTHYQSENAGPYDTRFSFPLTLDQWQSQEELDAKAHPLRLKDYVLQDPEPLLNFTQPITSATILAEWNTTSPLTGQRSLVEFEAGEYALRNDLSPWLEKESGFPPAVEGAYLMKFKLRSDVARPILANMHYRAGRGYRGGQYFMAGTAFTDEHQEILVHVDNDTDLDYMWPSFQDVQYGGDVWSTAGYELDDLTVTKYALVGGYPAAHVADNHKLFFNCPLSAISGQNAGPSFTIPGDPGQCWSDVHGNFYAAGETYELDEWASVVLFRMDVDAANLTLDGNGQHILAANTNWTDNLNVEGSLVVPDGITLTIDGAHIGFAPTTSELTTGLMVQPGGTLVLKNGATLRNWMGCGSAPEMWDGVKVLGIGTTTGAGLVVMESGARITDALTAIRCAEGPVNTIFGGNVGSGGIIQASNAVFENNFLDVVTRPHTVVDPAVWGPSSFTNCMFKRTRELHDTQLPPGGRVNLMSSASTPFLSCTFQNTTGDHSGMGIHAIDTRIKVEGAEEPATRSRFQGLDFAILHSAFSPTTLAVVDRCDFTDNKRGLLIAGADNSIVTRCTFAVANEPVNELGVEGAYGAYLFGCTGFEVEENTFSGTGTAHPKVGLVVRNTGIADNTFYNNTFSGFADASERSAGTIIMGANATTDFSTGLRIRCNDYDPEATNNFDVAFTGNAVSVAGEQGAPSPNAAAPAGNTFALVDPITCNGNDARHLYEDVEGALNDFSYWHHQPQAAVELVPQCNNVLVALENSVWQYTKTQACPVDLSGMVPIGVDEDIAEDADNEHGVLVAVYDNWKDGGHSEGLITFIQNPANSSYSVRNQLMLVAPKVSADAWKACFLRDPAMNPWHLAQALLANSPLERSVLATLDSSDIQPFYKELVLNGQGGGLSMHSIYKSEIAHFHSVKSSALQAMLRKSLTSGDSTEMANTLRALNEYPMVSKEQARFTMLLATDDLVAARTLVDERLLNARQDKGLWDIYDLLLDLREQNLSDTELDAAGITALQNIAASEGVGAAQASAWLALLGTPVEEVVLLPNRNKRLKPREETDAIAHYPMLGAYPNPSNGPVYITYTVVEGVEQVELQMHDAQGRLVKRQRIGNSNGIVEIQPRELSSGVNVVSLYFDNIRVGTTKLNIVK